MYEVVATYRDKKSIRFFEDWHEEEAKRSARLVHPRRERAVKLKIEPVRFDGSWHFYSVVFDYSAPDSARPKHMLGGGIHISFGYDEKEASRRLSWAINTITVAGLRAKVRMVSQYAWPDGSLYYWFASQLPLAEFKAKELARFRKELDYVSKHPFKLRAYYQNGKKKRAFIHLYGESRVSIQDVKEETTPYRRDPHKHGCLNLVGFFNGDRYEHHLACKEEFFVSKENAESFQEGFEVAYEHQNLFTPYIERRTVEEIETFAGGYYLARILQLLTE